MKTPLTRGLCIENDITDPTPWEEEAKSELIGECFLCGEEIDSDHDRIYTVDGLEDMLICEHCYCFKSFTPNTLLDMLGIDVTRCSGRTHAVRSQRKKIS